MRRAYGAGPAAGRHPPSDAAVAAVAAVAAIGCRLADPQLAAAVGLVVGGLVVVRAVRLMGAPAATLCIAGFAVVGGLAGARAAASWDDLAPSQLGPHHGWIGVVDEPQRYGASTRVMVAVDGERFEVWARGRALRIRVEEWRAGERFFVSGERRSLRPDRQERVAWQHVVGELRLDWVGDAAVGSPIDRASNRVRGAIERGAASLPGADGSLFRGLVIGDDRDQPSAMIERFRASGLSHLTAVSGQNVSFVLAAAGPLLRTLRPMVRWAATLALIGWFVSLTRFEPSIVRAGAMAAISTTGFVLGRERSPTRILAVAVTALVFIDPLLVHSVGLWLSVGATGGVTAIGPKLAARLDRLGPLAAPLGVTLGAQAGVIVPSVLVFGRLPLVSVPANLLAVPVAGAVMLYGLPAGLAAGLVPAVGPLVMLPCRLGVRWVDTVAALGARVEPGGAATWIGWVVLVVGLGLIAAMNRGRHGRPSADR